MTFASIPTFLGHSSLTADRKRAKIWPTASIKLDVSVFKASAPHHQHITRFGLSKATKNAISCRLKVNLTVYQDSIVSTRFFPGDIFIS